MKVLKFKIPESFDELSEKQFVKIVWLLFNYKTTKLIVKKVFKVLVNYKWWKFNKRINIRYLLSDVPLSQLKQYFDFVFSKNDRTKFLTEVRPEWSLLRPFKERPYFYPPMDRIINLTAAEFAAADDFHIKYRQTNDVVYLYYLAAVLYTPSKPGVDRPEFDKLKLKELMLPFKKVSLKKLLAIEVTYFGCKNNIVNRFKKAFPKHAKNPKKGYGFGKVILTMTKGDLSKLDKIQNVNVFTFLEQFQEDLIQAAKNTK